MVNGSQLYMFRRNSEYSKGEIPKPTVAKPKMNSRIDLIVSHFNRSAESEETLRTEVNGQEMPVCRLTVEEPSRSRDTAIWDMWQRMLAKIEAWRFAKVRSKRSYPWYALLDWR
jgi:hypothetical protein